MAVQQQTDLTTHPLILDGTPVTKRVAIADNDSRSGALVYGTVMAFDPTNTNWVPWTDETAADGTQYPSGILLQTYTEAEVKAGPIANVPMVIGGAALVLDENLVTIENSLTVDTIVNVPDTSDRAAWQILRDAGIFLMDTQEGTSYEAA